MKTSSWLSLGIWSTLPIIGNAGGPGGNVSLREDTKALYAPTTRRSATASMTPGVAVQANRKPMARKRESSVGQFTKGASL